MYFEEPWFVILCFRLNCPRNISMTTSASNVNLDDVEEGEIQDDDESVIPTENVELLKQPIHPAPLFNKLYTGFHIEPRRPSFPFKEHFRPVPPQHIPPGSAKSRERNASTSSNVNSAIKRRRNRNRRRRVRNRLRPPRILPRNACNRSRRQNAEDRSRAGTPYEDRLREFQLRQERIRKKSKSEKKKPTRSNAVGSHEGSSPGSSLLKRLVGSGSVGIKVLDENSALEQVKSIPSSTSDFPNSPLNNSFSPTEIQTRVEDIPVPDSHTDSTANALLVQDTSDGSRDIELKVPKMFVNSHESVSDSSLDLDDELIKLRMEALKTAVLKKHSERLKRGYVPKKTNKLIDDPIIDSFIEEVESIKEGNLEESLILPSYDVNKHSINVDQCDNSDMSMDSNYVSDDDTLGQNHVPCAASSDIKSGVILGVKRPLEEDVICKKQKIEDNSQDSSILNRDSFISDLNDEELELRALALQSFLKRKGLKDSDNESDKVSNNSDHKSEDILPDNKDKAEQFDNKPQQIRNDSENWEELDEDILRAQLLKTLSASLPERISQDNKTDSPVQMTSKTTSSAFSKKEIDTELEIQSRRWSEMMVPKLVISLGSDSESEPENPARDFVKSLDLLLLKAKEKSETTLSRRETKPKVKKKNSPKQPAKKLLLKKGPSGTPTAVKHLPIQQQEEYRRLKLKLAEKLKVNHIKSPDISPAISRTQSPMRSQGHSSNTNTLMQPEKDSLNVKVTTKSNPRIVDTFNPDSVKNSSVSALSLKSKPQDIASKSKVVPVKKTEVINRVATGVPKNSSITDIKRRVVKNTISLVSSLKPKTPAKPFTNLPVKNSNVLLSRSVSSLSSKNNVKTVVKGAPTRNQSNSNKPILPLERVITYSVNKLDNEAVKEDTVKSSKEAKEEHTCAEKTLLTLALPAQKDKSSENLGLQPKEVDGINDKENIVARNEDNLEKLKCEERIEDGKRLPLNECEMPSASLLEKLKLAEKDYNDTVVLISSLERELQEAKKTLMERGRTVAELKERVRGPSDQASLTVKVTNDDLTAKVVTGDDSQPIATLPSQRCWDPDGVLCPYQLAGCCKDSSCSFLHIHS